MKKNKYFIQPNIYNADLTKSVEGFDEKKQTIITKVVHEKPLNISQPH